METYWIDVCQRAHVCSLVIAVLGLGLTFFMGSCCMMAWSVKERAGLHVKLTLIISASITILAILGVIFIPTR